MAKHRDRWSMVFELALKAVVFITSNVHVGFDTHSKSRSTATGFVVDEKLGIILSNRHVMTCAPSTHYARFENLESIPLVPWYYDPVLDFAFFRYNPRDLKRARPIAIRLAPEKAVEGLEIRVISCESGESISVSSGTIADIRRRPSCAHCNFGFHNFNTFYYVAAAGTRGGSSGAPVLDIDGNAVALNAAAIHETQQSLFLPLQNVVKALRTLQSGGTLLRGTLQTVFLYETNEALAMAKVPFDQVRELYPECALARGLLKISSIVPQSPAAGRLHLGDVVLAANGNPVVDYMSLFAVLDQNTGGRVTLTIVRDGCLASVVVEVQDLFQLTPTKLFSIGAGCTDPGSVAVFNDLSYIAATCLNVPLSGVFVAEDNPLFASAGVKQGSIITHINCRAVPSLDAFIRELALLDNERGLLVRLISKDSISTPKVCVIPRIPAVYSFDVMERHAQSGHWTTQCIRPSRAAPHQIARQSAVPLTLQEKFSVFQRVHSSIVHIRYHGLAPCGSAANLSRHGEGFVASKEHGIIVCDKTTVPSSVGAISVVVANALAIEAWVAYIDPIGCLAYLRYDPSAITADSVEEAPMRGALQALNSIRMGDDVTYIVSNSGDMPVFCKTQLDVCELVPLADLDPRREQIMNIEAVMLRDRPSHLTNAFICDEEGFLRALWVTHATADNRGQGHCAFGIDVALAMPVIERLKSRLPICLRTLNVEFSSLSYLSASVYGLSSQRLREMALAVPYKRSVLVIQKASAFTEDEDTLKANDIVLKVNDQWVDSVSKVAAFFGNSPVKILVCRAGKELTLHPRLHSVKDALVKHVVYWAGMCIEDCSSAPGGLPSWPNTGVYIVKTRTATPSQNIMWPQMITHIDDTKICSMGDFLAAVKMLSVDTSKFVTKLLESSLVMADRVPGALVKIRTVNREGVVRTFVIETDDIYYPASQLVLSQGPLPSWVLTDV
ncbi:hypothetical protein H4R26_001706 [Coemansia thaxteri]|uniref:PDZ domain-containing protein n=1 Tax=Coemansia thaxteri TaxID=2663907 RepID=A0A9W8BL83_9FUNG|nr:hypothetical protein H4R26_001706 [Coemansia thaxteri]